ncbi:ATP-binding protein [Variovorax sp. J22R133]|uniref:ATP-binding protein n=1 Tax=Variovorax brevis TaxID=3053503 RepID=UPI002575C48D|nr:ATP-binding protein [Variovorax sp. J22R133]MDM0112222.1 ATP-binding protein [Variovorax sp. J22R133]
MNAPDRFLAWSDANQRLLAAEFARIQCLIGGEDDACARAAIDAARNEMHAPAAIDVVASGFGLSAFERDVLLLAAGAEMDSRIAALCAGASASQPSRAGASFALALASLPHAHWSALAPVRPLRRWRLIELQDDEALVSGRVRVDERVLHYLAGVNQIDPRLHPLLQAQQAPTVMAQPHAELADTVVTALRQRAAAPPVVMLVGDDASGQADVAAQAAATLGVALHALHAEDLPRDINALEQLAVLWRRDAALLSGALLLRVSEEPVPAHVGRFVDRVGGLVLVAAARQALPCERACLLFKVDKPDAAERRRLWTQALGDKAHALDGALDATASQFRLSARQIADEAASIAPLLAQDAKPDALLWRSCRDLMRPGLDQLAQRIDAAATWDDLILPAAQTDTLHQIAAHLRHRLKVYQAWGFAGKSARGLGVSALFSGESGTGKTMAAEVLAKELNLDLYRIDLSAVVSKYIGETEKNLRRVFDGAEGGGSILLFDEADALFGKRSEVKDSHDRYANIEVSYLLQRMEAYQGLAILTTNLKTSLDPAFQRRLRFIVQFPFPDQAEREAIWRQVFPPATPLQTLDYAKLARLQLAGGNIRNIALHAAFLAAEEGCAVGMAHVLRGAHNEGNKRERPITESETRGWV